MPIKIWYNPNIIKKELSDNQYKISDKKYNI